MSLTENQIKIRKLAEANNTKVRKEWKDKYKTKKPFYKKWEFWVIVVIILIVLGFGMVLVRNICC